MGGVPHQLVIGSQVIEIGLERIMPAERKKGENKNISRDEQRNEDDIKIFFVFFDKFHYSDFFIIFLNRKRIKAILKYHFRQFLTTRETVSFGPAFVLR